MITSTLLFVRALGTVVAIALLSAGLPGCVGYNVYPPEPGERGFANPNSDPMPVLMSESLRWVLTRYPPTGEIEGGGAPMGLGAGDPNARVAINLPAGINDKVYRRIVTNIGLNCVPMEPGYEKLPTYSVSRIWVSGDEARVDVHRPTAGLPVSAEGRPPTQVVTVRLRGGMKLWTVSDHNLWSINTQASPAINYVPGSTVKSPMPAVVEAPTSGATGSP